LKLKVLAPLLSHTGAENPTGQHLETKPLADSEGRHNASRPVRNPRRYETTATPTRFSIRHFEDGLAIGFPRVKRVLSADRHDD
jgi:hypothetical protein